MEQDGWNVLGEISVCEVLILVIGSSHLSTYWSCKLVYCISYGFSNGYVRFSKSMLVELILVISR